MRLFYSLVVFLLLSPAAADEGRLRLGLPLDCVPGATCWIANYVDLKPGKGVLDYNCGVATYDAPPDDRHKGTDFAVRDMAEVRRGVAVTAAAPGVVIGVRDSMQDVDFRSLPQGRLDNKECGNGVRIKHDNELITQYCHLRRNSVIVREGERVGRGKPLGMVGLSGMTMFPHLHFQVEKAKKILDPFSGADEMIRCGPGEQPLWDDAALAALPYRPTAIYNSGFAPLVPKDEDAREGLYREAKFPMDTLHIALWADIFNVQDGDEATLAITGPKGEKVMEKTNKIKKTQARRYFFIAKRRDGSIWTPGIYRGEAKLVRKNGDPKEYSVRQEITVR
ncbi:MAG: hypothetical protein A3G18_12970 [Rhodospirillales bacterium RIFCSPLOWO2_12_FULL_58_28]|nr:MAG: hypothetical protein A3H92_12825 [Rhodospirillales bacterium RIFCSPLOWO2_02_FULL_58_16]OHC78594.1 MAG: hypothetical protein A3G18_12970 [Rhodospirillales bacterium RIFCSPLOWO2_12_FULL_58_28]